MKKIIYFILILLTLAVKSYSATEVTYISSEGIYINAGTNASLNKGDTLLIYRGDIKIATVLIDNISSRSSACSIVEQFGSIQIGDLLKKIDGTLVQLNDELDEKNITKESKKAISPKREKDINKIRGYVAFQQYYQKDFTSSSLSSYQPSLKTKFRIDNINGSNLSFQMKHRSRMYHRSKSIIIGGDKNEWSHRIYEFALYSNNKAGSFQWSIGRQSVYQARGVGYIDGLYLSKELNDKVSVGTALGSEPDYLDQKIDFKRNKAALFINYINGDYEKGRLSLSAAVAGSYISGEINREFFSFTTDYYNSRFSVNQAVEIDMYRSWRKDAIGKTFSLANYYGRINYNVSDRIRLNFAYDNRNRIRYNDDVLIADSLFDNSSHQGVRFGTTIRLNRDVTFTGNTGIRFRSDEIDNNLFFNTGINIMRFPAQYNSLSFRFAYVNTMFTDAYRPSVSFRFPMFTKLRFTLTAASNIYKTGSNSTTNSYFDLSTYYTVSRDYFVSGSIRQYLDKELQSSQIFFELGRNF